MKRIFALYRADLRAIVTNWAAAVIILGLICLPSLYAWFNIKASWDPYGSTQGIRVAVVNLDKGAEILGNPVRIGDQIVASLRENKQIGWTFTDAEEAWEGVREGDYYASVTIPPNFSAEIATVTSDNPVKAVIEYAVNEKINAIAPKITSKGATGIMEEVSSSFVKTASRTLFELFNELGVELGRELPTIDKVKELIFRLEGAFPQIEEALGVTEKDVATSDAIIQAARQNLPAASQLAREGAAFAGGVGEVLGRSRETADALAPAVKQDIAVVRQTAEGAAGWTAALADNRTAPEEAARVLADAERRTGAASAIVQGTASLFERLDEAAGGGRFPAAISLLGQLRTKLEAELAVIRELAAAVAKGEAVSSELLDRWNARAQEASALSADVLARFDGEIAPKLRDSLSAAQQKAETAHGVLQDAVNRLPDVERILNDAAKLVGTGKEGLAAIRAELPGTEAKIRDLAAKIRAFEEKGDIREVIDLLQNNFEKESEFWAGPVELHETKLFPIPNYGSAMSPFFTTLSLWVGALLLVSLLTVEVHEDGGPPLRYYQIYIGRFLTFLTIALLQSLIVTTGDILVLKAYVLHPGWFIGFGLVLSTIFMLIVYTLVSLFGNVGKAMAIVLLVLQLAGSGGTFPIQVTPPFFQAIYPFLPFTYAISLMREAVGGILWPIVTRDLLLLAVFAGIALVLGLTLKKPLNRASARLVQKAKSSKLIH
ncbi:phage infection protein [Paenibacillus sp. J31TS4]|uniref:YhgE/Pip domain-containing protein n=1 Tax=Paenibacillus sp. J31TS4 TaxID=2807195 RepID=UPI001B13B485|nr:YhgE/Pip domain-containing protein [Paenibacillus sp. J31TS4]GIP40430.1 phage infection protein [Paenibacillus sp. J31TS4]